MRSVLKDLKSKNKKTENAALKELKRHFVELDKREQMLVLMHYVRREKSYRLWAYSRLLGLWDESYEPVITDLWDKYYEEQCAWPIVRLYHLDKMGMSSVADRYRNWYQKSLDGITDRQLWDWYRISTQLSLEGINHPYDFLTEKKAKNLDRLEIIKAT